MSYQSWQYPSAPDLTETLPARLRHVPREPDLLVYSLRTASALALRTFLHTYHRLEIVGREHLPQTGSFVMVSNHASHLDALCLLAALPYARLHHAFPAAAQDYFFVGLPRAALAAILFNAIPFARQVHLRQSLVLCRQLLANHGNILILFPEGTRTSSGAPGRFRPGIGSLLAGTAIPVVPCALHGTFRAWPKSALLPRPRKVRLVIGAPRHYAALPRGHDSSHRIAAELSAAVQELL